MNNRLTGSSSSASARLNRREVTGHGGPRIDLLHLGGRHDQLWTDGMISGIGPIISQEAMTGTPTFIAAWWYVYEPLCNFSGVLDDSFKWLRCFFSWQIWWKNGWCLEFQHFFFGEFGHDALTFNHHLIWLGDLGVAGVILVPRELYLTGAAALGSQMLQQGIWVSWDRHEDTILPIAWWFHPQSFRGKRPWMVKVCIMHVCTIDL